MGFTQIQYNTDQSEIERLLQSLDRPGDYCVHSKLVSLMPFLQVDGAGTVAFPVQEPQIRSLISVAERAPYGKGPETVLDTSVRDCWQIDSSAFELGGQGWTQSFTTIMEQVSDGLGCPSERLEARPYKLLIYEKGGFFTPHRDTEKQVGMVGTLVVSLPTEGAGGELVVRHGDRESTIDMCVNDPSMLAYAAFYADCRHETLPVREGHRVALVFNLILSGAGASKLGRAPEYSEQAAALAASLQTWSRQAQSGAKIAWLLDHDYSMAGLSFATLKGTDAAVARTLATAAETAECSLYAAILHISEYGSADYSSYEWSDDDDDLEMGEVADWNCGLEDWVDLDGSRPDFGRIPLLDGELLPDGALVDAYPDEKMVEEASGNAGVSVEHVYRMTTLVIWPKDKAVETLARGSVLGAVEYVESCLAAGSGSDIQTVGSRSLGEQLINAWNENRSDGWRYPQSDESLRRIIAVLVKIADPDLTLRFLATASIRGYSGCENKELVAAAGLVGADATGGFLPEFVESNVPRHPNQVIRLLWDLREACCDADGDDWRDVLSKATRAALTAVPHALNPPPNKGRPWHRPKPQSLDDRAVCDLISLVDEFASEADADDAVRLIANDPGAGTSDRVIPQALAKLCERSRQMTASPAYAALWQHATEFLLKRSSCFPKKPRDWFIDAQLECTCKGCVLLQAFCSDPTIREANIAVPQPMRQHLRDQIRRLGLDIDYETERKGRPYRLVCSKNRASYQRRLSQYADDIQQMKVLIGCTPASVLAGAYSRELEQLRAATTQSQ